MANADSRSVTTDALETLGSIIGDGEKRDAIHLAVEPAIATERCFAGQHVGLLSNGAASLFAETKLGIVDPFLTVPVEPGERFWLVVYPRQISSLRHVWEHPAFPASGETDAPPHSEAPMERSIAWLKNYAADIDTGYGALMDAARAYLDRGEYFVEGGKFEGISTHPDFWIHYERVTGVPVEADQRDSFFSCSC